MGNELSDLVQPDRVHRDVYCNPLVFDQESRRLFRRSWLYAGHISELPNPGDFLAMTLATQPVLIVRQDDHTLRAMHNRCAHKGTPLLTERAGNTGRMLRCPYHGWTYRPDGKLLSIPLKQAYENTGFEQCEQHQQLAPIERLHEYRGFIFVQLDNSGPGFVEYFGDVLGALDNMADRSPTGELTVAGPPLQHRIACNWKVYLENINDAMHPMAAHQSAWGTAREHWRDKPDDAPKPMAIEQMLPFGAGYEFFDQMGARILPNGHSFFGTKANIHSQYRSLEDYYQAMTAAYGQEKTDQILGFKSQNTVMYPTLSVKSLPLSIRVLRPVAVDQPILEVWTFRAKGAPESLTQRALTYNRFAFSPMSVVAHDDIHIFESVQKTLASDPNPWISLHRNGDEKSLANEGAIASDRNSGSEALMRNQFQAWASMMVGNSLGHS